MSKYVVSHDKDSSIVLFGTDKTLRTFALSTFKSVDGTFKIAPKNDFQVGRGGGLIKK